MNVTYTGLEVGRFGSLAFNLTGTYLVDLITQPRRDSHRAGSGYLSDTYDCVGYYSSESAVRQPAVASPFPDELADSVGSGPVVHLAVLRRSGRPDLGQQSAARPTASTVKLTRRELFRPRGELGCHGKGERHPGHQQRPGRQPVDQRQRSARPATATPTRRRTTPSVATCSCGHGWASKADRQRFDSPLGGGPSGPPLFFRTIAVHERRTAWRRPPGPQVPAADLPNPQAVDLVRGLVLVIRLDARAYRAASFLDDRILGPSTEGAWIPGAAVTQAARQVANAKPLHFVFHTGHVGSTLLSRLLDETGAVLGLREPLPLRTLADAHDVLGKSESLLGTPQFEALLDMLLGLWSRGYETTCAVVVKATSSAGRLAPRLLGQSPASRAVYLNLAAEPYLAQRCWRRELRPGPARPRPGPHAPPAGRPRTALAPLYALSIGELAALGWLVESLSQAAALEAAGSRLLALDFDVFLAHVPGELAKVLTHFELPHDDAAIAAIRGERRAPPIFEGARAAIPARGARRAPRGRAPRPFRRDRERARLARRGAVDASMAAVFERGAA